MKRKVVLVFLALLFLTITVKSEEVSFTIGGEIYSKEIPEDYDGAKQMIKDLVSLLSFYDAEFSNIEIKTKQELSAVKDIVEDTYVSVYEMDNTINNINTILDSISDNGKTMEELLADALIDIKNRDKTQYLVNLHYMYPGNSNHIFTLSGGLRLSSGLQFGLDLGAFVESTDISTVVTPGVGGFIGFAF